MYAIDAGPEPHQIKSNTGKASGGKIVCFSVHNKTRFLKQKTFYSLKKINRIIFRNYQRVS